MTVELSKCKRGDMLRTRNGNTAEYVKRSGDDEKWYPHVVRFVATGRSHCVCENGYFWKHTEDEPHFMDIVEIVGVPT